LEDLGVDGKVILKRILSRIGRHGMHSLAKDRDKWYAVVKAVMNLRVT